MTEENTNFYHLIGEEAGVRELVGQFYQVMESDPKARECLEVHQLVDGKVPEQVKQKLVDFLSGWLGGPQLFVQKYGHPRMRARHMHVPIAVVHAEQWLYCMQQAVDVHSRKLNSKQRQSLLNSFMALAARIVNS